MLRRRSKAGNAGHCASRQNRPQRVHFHPLKAVPSFARCVADRFESSNGAYTSEHPAKNPRGRRDDHTPIQNRSSLVCGRNGAPERAFQLVAESRFRRHLTPVCEWQSEPDTTRRVKRGQPAAACRFSEGNSSLCQSGAKTSWASSEVSNGHNRRTANPLSAIRIVCHPRGSGVTSPHANLLPVLHLLLLLYVLRRCVFWRREAR